jgi:GT2 family glycosyltransferase
MLPAPANQQLEWLPANRCGTVRTPNQTVPTTPTISVVIPVHNGAPFLRASLGALLAASVRDYEVIVVDDASTDSGAEIAREMATRVIHLPQRVGPATARNVGAAAARGEYLVFLDADVCLHADTIDELVNVLVDDPGVSAAFGSYDDRPACGGLVSQFRNLLHHDIHQSSHTSAVTFWAGCGAIRRECFWRLGGFDERYRRPDIEDIELGNRLSRAGGRIVLVKQAQVTHLKSWTFWSMIHCDFASRGIPWTRLILERRSLPNDLNLRYVHRASVVGVWLAALSFVAACINRHVVGWAALCGVAALMATIALNLPFYGRLRRHRGLAFAVRAVPLHLVHYAVCGAAFIAGCAVYAWEAVIGIETATRPTIDGSPAQSAAVALDVDELEELTA